jgi:hypothetical protein
MIDWQTKRKHLKCPLKENTFISLSNIFTVVSWNRPTYVFKIAEDNIHREFNNFQPLHIAQLLCSFVYIDRVPVNFASRILAPSFWIRCKGWSVSTHYSEYIGKWIKKVVLEEVTVEEEIFWVNNMSPFNKGET